MGQIKGGTVMYDKGLLRLMVVVVRALAAAALSNTHPPDGR